MLTARINEQMDKVIALADQCQWNSPGMLCIHLLIRYIQTMSASLCQSSIRMWVLFQFNLLNNFIDSLHLFSSAVTIIIGYLELSFGYSRLAEQLRQVGNWVDLVRYRKNPSWSYEETRKKADFFTGRLYAFYYHNLKPSNIFCAERPRMHRFL